MSVETSVITGLSSEGSLKKALQAGLTHDDFEICDEELAWMVERSESKMPITPIFFKRKFPEFDFQIVDEPLVDLIDELKKERAYIQISSAIDELLGGEDPLDQDNALDKASGFIEVIEQVRKMSGHHSYVLIKAGWEAHYQKMKSLAALRSNGDIPGIPTGLEHLDHHWGGLQGETAYLYLGRPGDAKSFSLAQLVIEAAWAGYRAVMFSPEMSEYQHTCRFHTLLSGKKEVQEACGLSEAFPNRALREGRGFNMKTYRRFFQWLDSIPRPKGLPPTGPIPPLPDPTPADLKAGLAVGGRQIGSPEEIAKVIDMYVELGVDQLIYAPLTLTLEQKHVLRSIETFGRHVLPRFDRDPVHSTTRQREAALAARAA